MKISSYFILDPTVLQNFCFKILQFYCKKKQIYDEHVGYNIQHDDGL